MCFTLVRQRLYNNLLLFRETPFRQEDSIISPPPKNTVITKSREYRVLERMLLSFTSVEVAKRLELMSIQQSWLFKG